MKKTRILLAIVTALICASIEYVNMPKSASVEKYISKRVNTDKQKKIRRYIITGGPGVGKTTIANELKKIQGFTAIDEAATRIIQKHLAEGTSKPWELKDFDEQIVAMQKEDRLNSNLLNEESIFFDRSSIDSISYCLHHQKTPQKKVIEAAEEVIDYYNPRVFLVENFGQCEQTAVRCETLEECHKIEQLLEKTYTALGFEVTRVKPGKVKDRIAAIVESMQ
jgi:predicted ATPase